MILGLAAQWLGQKSSIPRVTLLIGLGILAGPSGADLVSGECPDRQPESSNAYIKERFTGQFKRSLSLPGDIDPESATARYTNGVLHISLKRRAEAKARKIQVN